MEAIATRGLKNREVAIIGGHTWSQQAIKQIQQHIEACELHTVADPVNFKHAPSDDHLRQCREAATEMARILNGDN